MNLSEPFVRRPVATTLLTIGVALAGAVSFGLLPVSPLPQVDFPTVSVSASLPGASPEVMAATVATPLERARGRIAGITEMTSSSQLGRANVTLQFELSRDINGAAREVQAAIQAARTDLPSSLPSNPTYRKFNPADAPVMILALTSERYTPGQMYDIASTNLAQRISQMKGVGQVNVGGGSLPAVRRAHSAALEQARHRLRRGAHRDHRHQRQPAEGLPRRRRALLAGARQRPGEERRRVPADRGRLSQRRGGAPGRPGRRHRQRAGHAPP